MPMIETSKMSERGQIIIPKEIREEIGAVSNTIFAVSALDRETIVMKKLNTKLLVEEFQRLRGKTKKISSLKVEEKVDAARKA
ncbi:AbrB/MazE/SpoVT family DNA-binding domain-containing protein [Candidatus Woesearchaeota archaeon]|nr:AbrB/MazE/SpoVT family DNA-binding domain-containing protein [Candidatus Woesearchaeota archaeon]